MPICWRASTRDRITVQTISIEFVPRTLWRKRTDLGNDRDRSRLSQMRHRGGKSALFLASSINFIPRNGRGERRNEVKGDEKKRGERGRETVAYNVFVSRGKKGKRRASKWFVMTRKTVKPNRAPKIQPLGATTPRSSSSSSPASRFVEKLCDGTVLGSKLH